MLTIKVFLISFVVFVVSGTALAGATEMVAQATILDPAGKIIGLASLTEQPEGVTIVLRVSGLTPGMHGIHIHEKGVCTAPDFKSAGGHFNPFHKQHGINNPQGSHSGDLPNLEVNRDGIGATTIVARGLTLEKGLHSIIREG
ncbi:MAG: superoxide dismutase family protein, partial [Desulfuromonadales bacterium]|nr:superoxide dismutase family protein [Desulfuromonadales bacterium]